jgi:hypothetical protein
MGKSIGPTQERTEHATLISILAHNQVGRHWVYSGHYPRIFIAPKNARNTETKHQSGAVPILLLALSALVTSAHTSLGVLQESNPQSQLLKASGLPLSHISCRLSTYQPKSTSFSPTRTDLTVKLLRITGKWKKQKVYTMTWRLISQLIINIDGRGMVHIVVARCFHQFTCVKDFGVFRCRQNSF